MNTTTVAGREQILSMAAAMLPAHDPNPGELADLATALMAQAGISRDRARQYIAKSVRLRRGRNIKTGQVNFRASTETMRQLDELAIQFGSVSKALTVAVDRLHQQVLPGDYPGEVDGRAGDR